MPKRGKSGKGKKPKDKRGKRRGKQEPQIIGKKAK